MAFIEQIDSLPQFGFAMTVDNEVVKEEAPVAIDVLPNFDSTALTTRPASPSTSTSTTSTTLTTGVGRANLNRATKNRSEATVMNGMQVLSCNGKPVCAKGDETETPIYVSSELPTRFRTVEIGLESSPTYSWCGFCKCNVNVRAFTQHVDYHLAPVFRGESACPPSLEGEYDRRVARGRTSVTKQRRQQRARRTNKRKQDEESTEELTRCLLARFESATSTSSFYEDSASSHSSGMSTSDF